MLKISLKGIYGLAAVFELALHYNKEAIQVKDIAKNQNIPKTYLDHILLRLKNNGFIKSTRGTKGGYVLAKEPSMIKVDEVLNILEGELNLGKLSLNIESPTLKYFWKEQENNINLLFDKTLEDLISQKQVLDNNMMFEI